MIQGDVPGNDMIVGVIVLVMALPVLYWAGGMISRFRNRQFARAWQPVMTVLQKPKIVADQQVAASSLLTGTYRDVPVYASMTPNVAHGAAIDTRGLENRWEVGVRELPGASDWSIEWKRSILGLGETGWAVQTDDPALASRLEGAGVRDIPASLGPLRIEYRRQAATLAAHQDIRPLWAPSADRFRHELDVLLELAAVAAPLNPR